MTYHVVIAFDRDAEGDLKPGEAREVLSPIVAERRARALALEHAGALALVNELHKALVPPRGLIASGKFEQYKRDIPYATLAQAFRSLVRPILGESETQLVRWRKSLSEALGPNGQLIVNLVLRAGARDRKTAAGGGPAAAGRQKSLSVGFPALPRSVRAQGAPARPIPRRLAMAGCRDAQERHLVTREVYKQRRSAALVEWRGLAARRLALGMPCHS